jgi:hypothetical protein
MELVDGKMIHQSMQILGGVGLSLNRSAAMTAPVVREHAIPGRGKRGQLVDPHRRASRPRVREDDRHSFAAGVLVPESNAGQVRDHSVVF